MRKWLWLVLMAVGVPCVSLANVKVDDFAYGIRFDVPAGTAVAAMSMPEQVYANTYRRDLGDIRVFNANGEPVPHMIRYAKTQSAEAPWRSLAFFPIPEQVATMAGDYRIFVRTGPDGAVVRVDPLSGIVPTDPARTFLIDLSRVGRSLAQLRLGWQRGETNLMATLAVDASDDLVAWTTVQQRSVISDIRYGGRRLLNNTIALNPSKKRYLRLRQLGSGPAINLTRIDGRLQPQGRMAIRAFLKTDGQPVPESPGVFEYRSTGAYPVDRVNLIFGQANSMAEATLESRNDPKATWTRRFKGLFYRIDLDNTVLTSTPKPVPITMDRQWRLTVDASDSTIGSGVPRLEIGYRPHDLFFVARGNGPFTLAFGNAAAKPLNVNVAALFEGIGRHRENGLERWVMPQGPQLVLGGPQRLLPQPKPLPMRRIVLWSALLAGVLVLAVMAWRLARRLKE